MTRPLLALVALLVSVTPLSSEELGGVLVQEKQGAYRVMARFVVPHSASEVLRVLTDYEGIPRFMPDVKTSVVRIRSGGRALVEQQAQKRLLLFSKRIYLLLDIHEGSDVLTFVDTSGRSFSSYQGSWQVAEVDGVTHVSYQLDATPAFDVPQFVLMRVLRKDAADLVERLQIEIAARSRPR